MATSQIIFFVFMALCAVCLLYYLFKASRYIRRHTDEFGWPEMPCDDEDDEASTTENEQS